MSLRTFAQLQSCLEVPLISEAAQFLHNNCGNAYTPMQLLTELKVEVSARAVQYLRDNFATMIGKSCSTIGYNKASNQYYVIPKGRDELAELDQFIASLTVYTKLEILSMDNKVGKNVFNINTKGIDISDDELITRCDNRTLDLEKPAGKVCHFGGFVERYTENAFVTVWID